MRSPEVFIPVAVNKSIYLENGYKVEAVVNERPADVVIISDTAMHEAEHGGTAIFNGTGVKMLTIVPGPGYRGLAVFEKPDAIAAAAPHANGRDGTSYDMFVVQQMGISEGVAMSVARSIMANHRKEIHAIAEVLEEKGTIGSNEIREAISSVSQEENSGVTVYIKSPSGEEMKFNNLKTEGENVLVPGVIVDITGISRN